MNKISCFFYFIGMLVSIRLSAQVDSIELKQVELYGQKAESNPTQSTSELSDKELDKKRGSSLGEYLRQLPGVTVLQTGPTVFKPVLQGMYGQRVLIMNNGVRQEGQQWGTEHAPEIDPFTSNKIKVIKGASSVRYGSDAIGGVILIEPRPLRKESGTGGEIYLGGFSNNRGGNIATVLDFSSSKIKGLSARVQGSLKKMGNSKTPTYFMKNTGLEEYNFSYTLGYTSKNYGLDIFYSQFNTKLGILSSSHIGNLTDLKTAIANPRPLETSGFSYKINRPAQKVVHELFKAGGFLRTSTYGKLSFSYAFQYNERKEYDKHNSTTDPNKLFENSELELHITTHTAGVTYDYVGLKNLTTTIGITGITQGNVSLGRFFIPNFKSYAGGIFWVEQWEKKKWAIEIGSRYDYKWIQAYFYKNNNYTTPEFNFNNISGSFGAAYKATKNLTIRTNMGTGFRPPHVSELFSDGLHHGAAAVEIGNDKLKPERALNYSLSADMKYKKITGGASVYYTQVKNYIFLNPIFPATLTIRGAFPTFKYTQIDADFSGIDLWIMDTLNKHFSIQSKASVVYAFNNTMNEYLILTPPTRIENGLIYTFRLGKKILNPYVEISSPILFKKLHLPDSSDYSPSPPGYFLLDAHIGFSLKLGKQLMDIHVTGNNLTNTIYRDYLDRFRYYADGIGRNISLRLKFSF